ncbi:alpha/beta fold hydrolase [Pseudonocardia charpentierae]|uniref:AB hydrolase-1 domain-containing protein n=1 Tax=Pseudonocardia charpentierae TaxID=3075545 RepID=A0ABU2N754_9PSEU|nr:alpha/beta fold hydrolase [Pseudonocardia sp. DSM 45834]MDT0349770.1 hypothetical protein [Pseudonocardia sp. DSM 45834]
MTALESHQLERPDATIHYWSGGRLDATTIVLLHGATLDHHAWDPQVDALHDRFQLVVPDLSAHGESTAHHPVVPPAGGLTAGAASGAPVGFRARW